MRVIILLVPFVITATASFVFSLLVYPVVLMFCLVNIVIIIPLKFFGDQDFERNVNILINGLGLPLFLPLKSAKMLAPGLRIEYKYFSELGPFETLFHFIGFFISILVVGHST